MTNRVFKKPEGSDDVVGGSVEFLRASELFSQTEEGLRDVGSPILEGTFIESMPNKYNAQKLDFKFEKEDGGLVILNGAGNLGHNMRLINIGDYVQVIYNGKQEIKKGNYAGTLAHNFEVLTAE